MEAVKQRMAALKDEAQQATERAEKADVSLKVGVSCLVTWAHGDFGQLWFCVIPGCR